MPLPTFRPRIVHIETLAPAPASSHPGSEAAGDWDAPAATFAATGFDHVMADLDADGSTAAPDDAALQSLAASLKSRGLGLLLRLSLDQLPAAHPLWQAHPELQRAAGDDLPDPRVPTTDTHARHALRTDGDTVPAAAWWAGRLSTLARLGVTGFCLRLDGSASPEFFAAVIDAVRAVTPDCRFLAWTPGVPAPRVQAIAALPGAPFDAAFSSIAWWDCRAAWLADEAQRLHAFGSVIALAGVPATSGGYRPAATTATPLDEACRQRLLWLAAFTGDGLLVPSALAAEWREADDAGATLKRALALSAEKTVAQRSRPWQTLSSPDAAMLMLRTGFTDADADEDLVLVANTADRALPLDIAGSVARFDGLALVKGYWPASEAPDGGTASSFAGGEARLFTARTTRPATVAPQSGNRAAEVAARAPRISMEAITPCIDDGRFVTKRSVGEAFTVEADIFGEGHDRIAAALLWRAVDDEGWTEVPMQPLVNDRWQASFLLPRVGRYQYQVEAWLDVFGAYRNELDKKTADGQKVDLELREGALLVKAALGRAEADDRQQLALQLRRTLKALEPVPGAMKGTAAEADPEREQQRRVTLLLSEELHQAMQQADARAFRVRGLPVLQVDAERRAAGFSSWYELFPRSMGKDVHTHGTLRDVIARLPDIQAMGFDTLYFPPIHPIGRKHRKGPNNTLTAGPDDVGSPYAIGSEDGGHDALHPELGTLDDFQALREAAAAHGLELALDFAIQCSPDHPWLKDHPDWFTWRPDGTIRYAENPPKKYQDIVNVDFYAEGAVPGLWIALRDVVLFWIRQGVKVFRVDNPHTKPMPFWEWMIGDIRARHPDAIFLAEAFTRPKPMYRLAKVGFSQSYTYFTWRHSKQEFIDYLTELTQGPPKNFFRPHFFVNTPDIDPYFLQRSGRGGFVIRAALATLLSGLWGMYSGFELCEAAPVPGKEEYLDSEKYELRQRDWKQPGNIIGEITLLNRVRRANPALQSHLGVRFCNSTGDGILCFTKTHTGVGAAGDAGDRNIVFAAICLDPHHAQDCSVELPLEDWGLAEDAAIVCEDLVHGHSFTLRGRHHRISLDPNNLAFTIWRLRPEGGV